MTTVKKSEKVPAMVEAEADVLLEKLDDALKELEIAIEAYERSEVVKAKADAEAYERRCRDQLFEFLEDNDLQNVNGHGWTAYVTVRHGYDIISEAAVREELREVGMLDDYLTLDRAAIAKLASTARKKTGFDFPGVQSTEKRFLGVRKVD